MPPTDGADAVVSGPEPQEGMSAVRGERVWPGWGILRRWRPLVAATLVSGVVAFVLLRHSAGPGVYLVRDFVAVPQPAAPRTWFPDSAAQLRAWPLDAVSWVLSPVLTPGAQQLLMLVAVVVLTGSGVGALLTRAGTTAAVVGAAVAVWNPYFTERLLLGQAPTLLGYAALPWIVVALRWQARLRWRLLALACAAMPAALTPWGSVAAAVVAVVAALVVKHSRGRPAGRSVLWVSLIALLWCLPWLIPALSLRGAAADPAGAAAFALGDDTGLGPWVSGLLGGGTWSTAAVPPSRSSAGAVAASALLLTTAVVALAALVPLTRRRRWAAGALLVGPATVAAVLSGPLASTYAAAQQLPGLALVRDQHRLLGVALLTESVVVGLLVGEVARRWSWRVLPGVAGVILAATLVTVPDLPALVAQTYRPSTYPSAWKTVTRTIDTLPPGSTVASFPWQPLRRIPWGQTGAFLDPTPRAVTTPVVTSSVLTVPRGIRDVVVRDPGVAQNPAWATGEVTGASLRAAGVTHVLYWRTSPGEPPRDRQGWVVLAEAPDFVLWKVPHAG